MPRKAKDFSKGLIYKLCCKDTTIKEIYVGSSTNFTQRKRSHKNCCNLSSQNRHNLKVYQFIRENGGWDNWDMVLIEYFPCETELDLCRRENYFMNELQASLNSQSPHIYENSKEQLHEWYKNNKEKHKINTDKWREANREKILEQMKNYREENREKLNKQTLLLYHKNKTQYRRRQVEKITCECGCDVSRGNMKRHKTTPKHISFISAK